MATCTVTTTAPGKACGAPSVVEWTSRSGELLAECHAHYAPMTEAPTLVLGAPVTIHAWTHHHPGEVVVIGRTSVTVRGTTKAGRVFTRSIPIHEVIEHLSGRRSYVG